MMWIPFRSMKMKRFIFGFHRRAWCPKWTPDSRSCFMVTTANAVSLVPPLHGTASGPGRADRRDLVKRAKYRAFPPDPRASVTRPDTAGTRGAAQLPEMTLDDTREAQEEVV